MTEIERIKNSRKYTYTYIATGLNVVAHVYLLCVAQTFENNFDVIGQFSESQAWIIGLYFGANIGGKISHAQLNARK